MSDTPITKGLFDDSDWNEDIRAAKGFMNFRDGALWASMMFEYETRMHVIRNTGGSLDTLSSTIEAAVKKNPRIRLVIAGCFQELTGGVKALMGQIIEGRGQPPLGNSRPTRARLCYDRNIRTESSPFHFGIGDPFVGRDAGAGGLCPMLLTDDSVYPPSRQTFLTDPFFQGLDKESPGTGRTFIARNRRKALLLAIVQPHASRPGRILSSFMTKLREAGVDDAVSLDGSDSVFFFFNGVWAVGPPPTHKDVRNVTAIGFSYDPFT